MFYVHNQWYDISCATLYVGRGGGVALPLRATAELFASVEERIKIEMYPAVIVAKCVHCNSLTQYTSFIVSFTATCFCSNSDPSSGLL